MWQSCRSWSLKRDSALFLSIMVRNYQGCRGPAESRVLCEVWGWDLIREVGGWEVWGWETGHFRGWWRAVLHARSSFSVIV